MGRLRRELVYLSLGIVMVESLEVGKWWKNRRGIAYNCDRYRPHRE